MPKAEKTKGGFKVTKDENDLKKDAAKNINATQHEKLDYIIAMLEKVQP